MAILSRVLFPVRAAEWKRTSRFIILSMITWLIGFRIVVRMGLAKTYLEVNIRVVPPAPGGTNNRVESCCKEFRERVYCCLRSLVVWVSGVKARVSADILCAR